MGKRSVEITVTPRQRVILKRVTRSKKAAQQLVERCRVVLLSATGLHSALVFNCLVSAAVDLRHFHLARRQHCEPVPLALEPRRLC